MVRSIVLLSVAEVFAMTVWFSASAVIPQLEIEWTLSKGQAAWLAIALQLGFVVGAFWSAILNLPDRFPSRIVFVAGSLGAAVFNIAMVYTEGLEAAIVFRFLTGCMLAGVYPPGMKLVATWTEKSRGLWIGVLVGALTLGSASAHLLNLIPGVNQYGMPPWQSIIWATSILALVSAFLVLMGVQEGPHLSSRRRFDWKGLHLIRRDRAVRLANLGYLGHMWELYAAWIWVPLLLIDVYKKAGWSIAEARIAGFSFIAVGCIGSILAGIAADRIGRTTITMLSLSVSGACCLSAGVLIAEPIAFTALTLVWGVAVVADSAQFSTAVSELSSPEYVGTALTLQTCLGFLLTIVSIRLVPFIQAEMGWGPALSILSIGPAAGIYSMALLRKSPKAQRMASGRK